MFLELESGQWHTPTLETFGINPSILPTIHSNCEIYGRVQSGQLTGVPIAGSLGDQHAALLGMLGLMAMEDLCLGHGCQKGEAKNTYGTGCFLLLNTGDQLVHSTHGLITGIGFKLGPDAQTQYILEGDRRSICTNAFVIFRLCCDCWIDL